MRCKITKPEIRKIKKINVKMNVKTCRKRTPKMVWDLYSGSQVRNESIEYDAFQVDLAKTDEGKRPIIPTQHY